METRLKSFLVVLTAAIICCFSNFNASAQGTGASLNPDIASLETRFFDHTYPQESMDTRLDRLERMVFGEQKTGSDQARMTALLLAVPAEPTASSSSPSANASANSGVEQPVAAANPQSTQPAANQTAGQTAPSTSDNTSSDVTNSSDYPRITQLEQEILGKTFTKEPIQNRLEQLELKAFGKATTGSDLSDRTEALEDYADKHFPQQQQSYQQTADGGYPAASPQYSQPSPYSQYAPPSADGYPAASGVNSLPPHSTLDQKVTWLEQQVFGTTNPTEPLLDRVNRLASNIFPADSPQRTQSLADQVSSMIGAVELMPKRGSASIAQAPQYNQAPQYSQSPQYSPPAPFSQYQQQPEQYGATPGYPTQYDPSTALAGTPTTPATPANHGHSFMHGLAHVLGAVGSMAAGQMAGTMMMGGMGGGGYGMPFGL